MVCCCRNADVTKELDGSRQTVVQKQREIDQLQNDVSALSSDNILPGFSYCLVWFKIVRGPFLWSNPIFPVNKTWHAQTDGPMARADGYRWLLPVVVYSRKNWTQPCEAKRSVWAVDYRKHLPQLFIRPFWMHEMLTSLLRPMLHSEVCLSVCLSRSIQPSTLWGTVNWVLVVVTAICQGR